MGENGGASITATEVAEKRGTINYEVLCLLSDRVYLVAMTNIKKEIQFDTGFLILGKIVSMCYNS